MTETFWTSFTFTTTTNMNIPKYKKEELNEWFCQNDSHAIVIITKAMGQVKHPKPFYELMHIYEYTCNLLNIKMAINPVDFPEVFSPEYFKRKFNPHEFLFTNFWFDVCFNGSISVCDVEKSLAWSLCCGNTRLSMEGHLSVSIYRMIQKTNDSQLWLRLFTLILGLRDASVQSGRTSSEHWELLGKTVG